MISIRASCRAWKSECILNIEYRLKDTKKFIDEEISLFYRENKSVPKTDPLGTHKKSNCHFIPIVMDQINVRL